MMPPAEARCERPRITIPRTPVYKAKKKGRESSFSPAPSKALFFVYPFSQAAVVVTFLQVPGVPPAVHTNSVPAESMYTSPLL
jgi:hypothetical protein